MSEAQRFLDGITGLAIESLEEPLAEPTPEALHRLQDSTRIALALDESLAGYPRSQLLTQPPVRRLILKPPALGGLQPALSLAVQAAEAGMESLVTSTLESALGLQAAAQLAAALPPTNQPLAQGLATASWFQQDLGEAAVVIQGQMHLPDTAGLGIRLKSEFLHQE
jgi:L-alanine-DL-glutamate epimerase-like enolase superfamily enzyme